MAASILSTVKKKLTPYNYQTGNVSRIKYIAIHYVGALGGAEQNCNYYAGAYRAASAHYFVGFNGEIWQCVEDKNIAWHVGSSNGYVHPYCRNSNALGIEMCVRNSSGNLSAYSKDWYFEDATVEATIQLTKELMAKYNVPIENVIRHYDVTGKICPNPYVYNNTKHTWDAFKKALTSGTTASTSKPSAPTTSTTTKEKAVTDAIVSAVIAGKYGNGAERKKKLEAEGYNYADVQAAVDAKMKKNNSSSTTTTKKPAATTTTPTKKAVTEAVVNDVIAGKYGNGDTRTKKLKEAGYDPTEVQAAVNKKLSASNSSTTTNKKPATTTTTTTKKVVTEAVVNYVIAGKYGNGDARKKKLEAEGYNYAEVQAAVDKKMNASKKKAPTDAIVNAVIAGKYGNGDARKKKLEAEGYDYAAVQAAVNKKLKK